MRRKLTIVCADDWEGLYVNGKLFYQDHYISADALASALELDINYVDGERHLEANHFFPENLKELKQVKMQQNL